MQPMPATTQLLLGKDGGGGAQAGIDGEVSGDVVGGLVLDEGGFEQCGDAAGFPVHKSW